jgi:hypothetical protein
VQRITGEIGKEVVGREMWVWAWACMWERGRCWDLGGEVFAPSRAMGMVGELISASQRKKRR